MAKQETVYKGAELGTFLLECVQQKRDISFNCAYMLLSMAGKQSSVNIKTVVSGFGELLIKTRES